MGQLDALVDQINQAYRRDGAIGAEYLLVVASRP